MKRDSGIHFLAQLKTDNLDPFSVLGLDPNDKELTRYFAWLTARNIVCYHVYKYEGWYICTEGPTVPTWHVFSTACDMLLKDQQEFERLKSYWSTRSLLVWNPWVPPGRQVACSSPDEPYGDCMRSNGG